MKPKKKRAERTIFDADCFDPQSEPAAPTVKVRPRSTILGFCPESLSERQYPADEWENEHVESA